MLFDKAMDEVNILRDKFGKDICTDPVFTDGVVSYMFMQGESSGYIVEIRPETGERRRCGFGVSCFWTDWE